MQNEDSINLNIGRASKYLGVSIDTLRRWEKKGKLIAYRSPGGHRYFKKEDLDKLFNIRYERNVETSISSPNNNIGSSSIQSTSTENKQNTIDQTNISSFEIPNKENESPVPSESNPQENSELPKVTNSNTDNLSIQNQEQENVPTDSKLPEVKETELDQISKEIQEKPIGLGVETHIHLPIPTEEFTFTATNPEVKLQISENPKLELPQAESRIVPSYETPKSLEIENSPIKPIIAETTENQLPKASEDFPKDSILLPQQTTNKFKLDEIEQKPWKNVQVDTFLSQSKEKEEKRDLSQIIEPEKPKKRSKFVSFAVWAILFFSIIDLIMFFLWFSSTKIISPIP